MWTTADLAGRGPSHAGAAHRSRALRAADRVLALRMTGTSGVIGGPTLAVRGTGSICVAGSLLTASGVGAGVITGTLPMLPGTTLCSWEVIGSASFCSGVISVVTLCSVPSAASCVCVLSSDGVRVYICLKSVNAVVNVETVRCNWGSSSAAVFGTIREHAVARSDMAAWNSSSGLDPGMENASGNHARESDTRFVSVLATSTL